MLVKNLLPAFVAIGSAAAQSGTCSISGGTTTINNPAEATGLANCRTVRGSVVIGRSAGPSIDLSGPSEITGDLKVADNGIIETLQSSDLATIGGKFQLKNVTKLTSVSMSKLTAAKEIEWDTVTNIESVTLGPVNKVDDIRISITSLRNLDALDLGNVANLKLDNNARLSKFSSNLRTLSKNLVLASNGIGGIGLEVELPNLVWAVELDINNVTTFSVPSLKTVNGSARFGSNFFQSFSAPNLTATSSGDISFIGNAKLTNATFPKLEAIAGGLTIANNTNLDELTGFPKLKSIGGAVLLRGNFESVEMPALDTVRGTFDASSSADISESCKAFDKLAPQNQGGNGVIAGGYDCTSNNTQANEDTDGSTSGNDGSGGSDDKDNGAVGMALNTGLFAIIALAGFAVAL
ncbi:cell wall protein Ecm33 [Podospora pseudoanserina]|uniref:Cell wall protein Ecm33 n=1 Tax=Podospora pseudoanserina TaxID=2609844 RepID=A0ABR0IJU7_9PEZI|nr:cell wall protein Ecm33 [Podospora pseudoanserina]